MSVFAGIFGAAMLAGSIAMPVEWAEARSTRALVAGAGGLRDGEPLFLHRLLAPSLGFYAGRIPVHVPSRFKTNMRSGIARSIAVLRASTRLRASSALFRSVMSRPTP